jgi:hypothetical protein
MAKDNEAGPVLPDGGEELTAALAAMGDSASLSTLHADLVAKFDELADSMQDAPTMEGIEKLQVLKTQVLAVKERGAALDAENDERVSALAALREAVKPVAEAPEAGGDDEGSGEISAPKIEAGPVREPELVAAASQATITAAVSAAVGETMKAFASDYLKPDIDLNKRLRLGTIAQYAPDAKVKEARNEAVIIASADVPGFTQGGRLENIAELGKAFHKRAKSLPISRTGNPEAVPVASLEREFTFTLNKNSTPEEMNDVLMAASDEDVLVAAGGWCAPSEISYDFFNVVCEDGMIDLPTVGLNRGGVQYPTSPSFGDLASDPGIVWTWTEADDIEAVDSSSIFKPCVRVECPTFIDRRADCDGFCVTAGNLIDYAYPELISNWLRLVMAIRAKATNARIIDLMLNGGGSGDAITASIAVSHAGLLGATTSALLTSIELSAIDYREKYSMCFDAILEVVMPRWANAVIRADLANRDGINVFSVTDAMIADWFNIRGVRVQFVGDWQVRDADEPGFATPITEWPATMDYMIYAPGTFVRGNSMSLDLGVVRDSVLNSTNDHTAAWAEDCYALLKPGHESRVVTVDICGSGEIGERSITCAGS